ncbi:MAG: radical SAM/SPASM domain-containing protein [Candidatus Rifleibacteriota bacterium]
MSITTLLSDCLDFFREKKVHKRFTLQWHITEKCNLECSHCYEIFKNRPEADISLVHLALSQFNELLSQYQTLKHSIKIFGHINLTGGEPLLHPNFWEIIKLIKNQPDRRYSWGLLTNGTLIDAAMARKIADENPALVQISIDGKEETHDRIRGMGSFNRAVAGVKNLVQTGIRPIISFTASSENYLEFPQVVELANRIGARKVWSDRYLPMKKDPAQPEFLNRGQTDKFFSLMRQERCQARNNQQRAVVEMNRALQFLKTETRPYRCNAGRWLLCLQADGTLLPCRRLPIELGNIKEHEISKIYFNNSFIKQLKEPELFPEECRPCRFRYQCGGGLRCLSAAVHGDPFRRDPGCWMDFTDQKQVNLSKNRFISSNCEASLW